MNKRNNTKTQFVRLDRKKCVACWECVKKCPGKVIGKIDLFWHKHAIIKDAANCTGCLRCINACESGALLKTHT